MYEVNSNAKNMEHLLFAWRCVTAFTFVSVKCCRHTLLFQMAFLSVNNEEICSFSHCKCFSKIILLYIDLLSIYRCLVIHLHFAQKDVVIFEFNFDIFEHCVYFHLKSDLNSLFRTWVPMSWQSVCRTSTRTSLIASTLSSKVLLNSYTKEEWWISVNITNILFVLLFLRFLRSCGECNGWSREVHDDTSLQGSLLSRDHRRWEERPGYSEENQVCKSSNKAYIAFLAVINLSEFPLSTRKQDYRWNHYIWEVFTAFCYRALHWVTIEMLCVPVDEEIPEVSDSVVKAITGKPQ